ncbi:MAG: trypsin-like peptidase domain-containing protein [Clostridiales bacterium]|nr:trypsin-like peptidase domain-containing protein [Clostridiales bacterium]
MENKKFSLIKILGIMLCAMALIFGSGYTGAMLFHELNSPPVGVVGEVQPPGPAIMPIARDFPSAADKLSLPDLFEGANPAVVAISTEISGRNVFGQTITRPAGGSGFFVSPNGYIVTNSHVIEGANSITVLLHDGSAHPATVVGHEPASDLAVIKIEGTNWPYLSLGDSDIMRVGEQVAAIGNPLGQLANSMTIGYISGFNRYITLDNITINMLQTDAAVNRGNSGGPLLNLRGEVIGIVTAKSVGTDVEGLGFAIPSNYAKTIVDQLINYGFVRGRAVLGITVQEIPAGVQIVSTAAGSAAQRAGLAIGDILLSANGAQITNFGDLRAILDEAAPGDALELRLRRGQAELTLTAILDEYRPSEL